MGDRERTLEGEAPLLGGTAFLGRAVVDAALSWCRRRLFARGRTSPGLCRAEHVVGDRESQLTLLGESGEFDAVVDTATICLRSLRTSAELLAGRTGQCIFISISVYEDAEVLTEDTPTRRPEDPQSRDQTGTTAA